MAEKLSASEEMVLELQKELNYIVKDKVTFLCCSQIRTFEEFIKKLILHILCQSLWSPPVWALLHINDNLEAGGEKKKGVRKISSCREFYKYAEYTKFYKYKILQYTKKITNTNISSRENCRVWFPEKFYFSLVLK